MLTESDLTTLFFLYLGGAFTGWLVLWMMTRWLWPQALRGQIRAAVMVLLITPSPIVPGGKLGAPAWVVLMVDLLRNGTVTRQDTVNWFIAFGIVICGWAVIWAIISGIVARVRVKREAERKLEEKRQLAAARMDDPFGDGITSPAGEIEFEETPVKLQGLPSRRLSKS